MARSKSIASDVGYLAAAFMAPRTFQKSMMERDAVDQGIVTGLTMMLSYAVGTLLQDGVEAATYQATKDSSAGAKTKGLLGSMLAVGAGIALQTVIQQDENESTSRGVLRTAGYWLTIAGAAGTLLQGLDYAVDNGDEDPNSLSSFYTLPIGVLIALFFDYAKYRKFPLRDSYIANSPGRVVGISAAVIGLLSGLSFTEKFLAKNIQVSVDTYAKPLSRGWLPLGHILSMGGLLAASGYGLSKLYKKIESAQDVIEEGFNNQPKSSYVSGDSYSAADWNTLSVQGRRHIATRIPALKLNTDLSITSAKEPIRLYIGVDSAVTVDERVQLALNELERTDAYSRKYIMLIAPTGTGYVNYVMSDTLEYLSKGDCAQITLQYSKRPSPMSLDKVDDGFIQFRIFVNAVAKRIKTMQEGKKPTIIIFGESLGAWVSQDAFLHSGTDGLLATGIDYALWIGTPELSKWRNYAESNNKLNMDESLVAMFDGIKDYQKIPLEQRKQLRYVMVTHHNDPVAHFSASLLIKSPKWLKRGKERPTTLPDSAHYRTPTTFVQTAIDMKNALKPKPGIFTSHGHDYRADLLEFMNEVFDFHKNSDELSKINTLIVKNDKTRGGL